MENNSASERRIFIRAKDRICQIFSFTQRPDGSIYCSSPHFANAKWLSVQDTENGPQPISIDPIDEGKISFHASGMVAVRPHNELKGHKLIIKGNHLLNDEKKSLGTRHLFTVFMEEPKYKPLISQLSNRKSDYCIEANEELRPFVLVFFAVPRQNFTLEFKFTLHEDDMVNIPNDFLGLNFFSLRYHDVFWFVYRTKHLTKWPKNSHICYHDGFTFPIFIGTRNETFRLEFRQPKYSVIGKKLILEISADYPDDYSNP